jgi:hypothetical protein
MVRPKGRVKTKTIKERAIYVYLPSQEMVRDWKKLAGKSGVSISKFVQEHVENSLAQEKEEQFIPRAKLLKQVESLEEENSKLRTDNQMLRRAYKRLDQELKHYRAKPFLEAEFKGAGAYPKELIKVLKERKQVGNQELLDLLGVDPGDSEGAKAISKQIESLEAYGLVEITPRGWRWIG